MIAKNPMATNSGKVIRRLFDFPPDNWQGVDADGLAAGMESDLSIKETPQDAWSLGGEM